MTALQSEKGRGTATVQQIGGGGDSVVLGKISLYLGVSGFSDLIIFFILIISGEIRDSINHVKRDMANQYAGGKGAQAQTKLSCPEVSCTSTTVLLGALAAQLVILMAYLMYRDNKEHQAKKFY